MQAPQVIVQGTLKPDGTLELDEKPNLPPGRVQVTVASTVVSPGVKEDLWTLLERIWAERKAMGLKPRTREEIDADVQALRDELEDHAKQVEGFQEEAWKARENPPC